MARTIQNLALQLERGGFRLPRAYDTLKEFRDFLTENPQEKVLFSVKGAGGEQFSEEELKAVGLWDIAQNFIPKTQQEFRDILTGIGFQSDRINEALTNRPNFNYDDLVATSRPGAGGISGQASFKPSVFTQEELERRSSLAQAETEARPTVIQPQTLGTTAQQIPQGIQPTSTGQQVPQTGYTGVSIVDYLKSIQQPSDFPSRANLAKQKGIQNYTGTAMQNTQLLSLLRQSQKELQPTATQPIAEPAPAVVQPKPQRFGEPIEQFTQRIDQQLQAPTPIPVPTPTLPSVSTSTSIPTPTPPPPSISPSPPTPPPPVVQTSEAERARIRAEGIAAQKAELEKGLIIPPPFSSVAEFDKLRAEQGIVKDQEELLSIQNEAVLGKEELRKFTVGQVGLPEGGRIGAVSEAERNLNFRLEGLAIREQAVVNRLNLKNSYISTVMGLKKEDYQTTYTNYTNEYNKNVRAVELYNSQLATEDKDALTALTTVSNLFKDKQIDFSTLGPTLKAQISTFETKLGIPGLFQAALSATPDAKILAPIIVDTATGKDVYFFTQSADGTPHLQQVSKLVGEKTITGDIRQFEDAKRLGFIPESTTFFEFQKQLKEAERKPVISNGKVTFSDTQIAKGATTADLTIREFQGLDQDTQNFFINNSEQLNSKKKLIDEAKIKKEDPNSIKREIETSSLPETAKQVLIKYLNKVFPPKEQANVPWWNRLSQFVHSIP